MTCGRAVGVARAAREVLATANHGITSSPRRGEGACAGSTGVCLAVGPDLPKGDSAFAWWPHGHLNRGLLEAASTRGVRLRASDCAGRAAAVTGAYNRFNRSRGIP